MQGYWEFETKRGAFRVVPMQGGGYQAMFEDEALGPYGSAADAAYELANGTTFWPSFGDPSPLRIPEDIENWTFIPMRQTPR